MAESPEQRERPAGESGPAVSFEQSPNRSRKGAGDNRDGVC
jgi:hypothetical protein